jgi:hypothetical protein
MSDLIDRQAAIDAIRASTSKYTGFMEMEMYTADDAVEAIEAVPAASPWHRVEEKPRDGQECIVAYLGPTHWIYEHATYHSDLNKALEEDIFIEGTDGFIVDEDVGYARHGLFKYWMPIEPPKEDADADK